LWLADFCRDVFVGQLPADKASRVIQGGVDGYCARHGTPEEAGERQLLEQAGWFVHDTKLLDADMGIEDMRVAVLEHLEKFNGRSA